MFNNWPYTNLNELNLDWILQQVKGIEDKYKDLDSTIAAGVEAVQHQEETSLQDMDNMKMTIISAINGARDVAIVDVNATKTNAINDIETDKTDALTAIAALGNTWDAHYESLIAEMPADLASLTQTLAILGRILTGESEQTVTFFMGDYAGGSKTNPAPTSTSDVSTNMIIGGAGFKFAFTLDDDVDADTKIYTIRWFEGKNASTGVYTGEHVVSCGNVRTYNWTVPDTCYGFSITLRNSDTLFTEAPASDTVTLRWYTTLSDFVSVDGDQDFTDEQKAQGRENIGAASDDDITELKSAINNVESESDNIAELFLTLYEHSSYGSNNWYRYVETKLTQGNKYAFKVTSNVAGTFLFQVGTGESASYMTDIGTYTFDAGETKTIFGYVPNNSDLRWFRFYSANVPAGSNSWDIDVYNVIDINDTLEATENKISENTSKLTENSIFYPIDGKWYNTSADSITIGSPNSDATWACALVPCTADDVFTITGSGGSSPKLWAFVDENGNVLERAPLPTRVNEEIIAPYQAAYLVVNVNVSYPYLLIKGAIISNLIKIPDFEERDDTKRRIVVASDGSGDFTTITAAINSISNGTIAKQHEIAVKEGTYTEQNLVLPPFTHLHGIGRNKPVITSVGLSDYLSVIDCNASCKISNLQIISGTKYCLHLDSYLNKCTVICEDVDFVQIGTMNQTTVGCGAFINSNYVFTGCTFTDGEFYNHTNSQSEVGLTQKLTIKYCTFDNSKIVLATSGSAESNSSAQCICEIIGCKGDPNGTLLMCASSSGIEYPWKVVGGCNQNFRVYYEGDNFDDVINVTDTIIKTN